jgi:hypothetical protein
MKGIGWTFGRLDFLLPDGKLIFLEVNPNGQWAWLDLHNNNGLLAKMLDCIDRTTPMPEVIQRFSLVIRRALNTGQTRGVASGRQCRIAPQRLSLRRQSFAPRIAAMIASVT